MKTICSLVAALALCSVSYSQSVESNSGAAASSIPYATLQAIAKDDSSAVIAEKAAKVLPRANQTAWMRMERTFFLHYGPNTFHGVEWGSGRENPSLFNPTAFDAEQWMRAMKDASGKMVVLVCKHHDGLCLWQTRYTNHSVAAQSLARRQGRRGPRGRRSRARNTTSSSESTSRPPIFTSCGPIRRIPIRYYGNRSPKLRSTIPTDPASFTTDPSKGRTPPEGSKTYTYEVDDYNRYFLNQLYELLTEYGPIYEVWFDGANPDRSVPETYDYAAWYDLIRKLRPDAIIACKGPDVRWVGNEGGVGRTTRMERHSIAEAARYVYLARPRAAGPRQPRQARARLVPLVVSGGSQPAHPLWLVLGRGKRRADRRGFGQHLLSVCGPQRRLAVEPLARHPRADSGQPACLLEPVVASDPRYVCEEPRRRRHADRRLVQPSERAVVGPGRQPRHLVGSCAGQDDVSN